MSRVLDIPLNPIISTSEQEALRMANKTAVSVKPLADRVVVLPLEDEEQMRGGLYIPDTAKEKPQSGKIVAVGAGKLSEEGVRIEPDVEVGQTVLYGKYSGTEVTVEGEEYLILRESDILAILG
jgi:chaperonin GroES